MPGCQEPSASSEIKNLSPTVKVWCEHIKALLANAMRGSVKGCAERPARPSLGFVVGHSGGANAALKMAETTQLEALVLIGAGFRAEERARDAEARRNAAASKKPRANNEDIVPPFNYASIIRNVKCSPKVRIYN